MASPLSGEADIKLIDIITEKIILDGTTYSGRDRWAKRILASCRIR